MPDLELVFSPALLPLYKPEGKAVVVIDILRATTSMCVAFETGVKTILPVATPEEALIYKEKDYLCAAERDAVKVDGFDLGNSPFEFQDPSLKGRNIAFTTTNGTKSIQLAENLGASDILIGSFLNLDAICNKLKELNKDTILLCAGWKDKCNLEDTLFAGAVAQKVSDSFTTDCDCTLIAKTLYNARLDDLEDFVRESAHAKRFKLLHPNHDDVKFCMQQNTTQVVPLLKNGTLSL